MSLSEQLLGYNAGAYVELFDILVEDISGLFADNLYYTPNIHWSENTGSYNGFNWKGNDYVHIPAKTSGYKQDLEGAQAQPTFTISNIEHNRLIPLLTLHKQLLGARVVRWRTFENFITDPSQPYISKEVYVISKMTKLTNKEVTFKLISESDRDDAKIPFRQVLRDEHRHAGQIYRFPGVARDGSRRR